MHPTEGVTDSHVHLRISSAPPEVLVFFIPGNPGLIAYYHAFLVHLTKHLGTTCGTQGVAVVGSSLGNFAAHDSPSPLSLQAQIQRVEADLHRWAKTSLSTSTTTNDRKLLRVILVGHSVGAYIAMELLRRRMESNENARLVRIEAVIGLWPTVTHLAKSPRGRSMGWALTLPFFAVLVSLAVWLLNLLVPVSFLRGLVALVTGFPTAAVDTTVQLVQRPYAVRQALHLAGDEMREIGPDRWADDLWHAGRTGPQIRLLFGAEDHWVANGARAELIKAREATPEREGAMVEIDAGNIPHSFCIRYSENVATRTARSVGEILERHA